MPNNIDNRVVNMQFNNGQFENNIQQSIRSLDTLKKGLKLDESARSLSNLNKAGDNFNLSNISNGVSSIASKFTALGIVGVTALANIANAAINAGISLVKSLSIDSIMQGFSEYETKINAIKVMMANLGNKATLDDIKKALAELNEYADLTIYNFAEMTSAAGKFTAAGVGLEDSLTTVKGLANLAAGGGVDPTRLVGAYTQVSQALQSGTFQWIDWFSMIQAGLSSPALEERLIANARAMGKNVAVGAKFKDTLKDGWLTTDVFLKTMKDATDISTDWGRRLTAAATEVSTLTSLIGTMRESVGSGWASTWETIFGDKEQATAFFTSINNSFGKMVGVMAEARNATLAYWNANGGRDAVIEALTSAFKGLASILKPIGEAFREIFPKTTGDQLIMVSRSFRDFMANFKIGAETSKNLKNAFMGVFSVLDIGKMAITALIKGAAGLIKALKPLGNLLLHIAGSLGYFMTTLRNTIKASDSFNAIMNSMMAILQPIGTKLNDMVNIIINAFDAIESPKLTGLDAFEAKVKERFASLGKLGDLFKGFVVFFYNLGSVITKAFGDLSKNIIDALNAGDFNQVADMINSSLFAMILLGIRNFTKSLTDLVDNVSGTLAQITGIFDGVRGCLEAYQNNLKASILLKIAEAIGILAVSLLVISTIDSEKLTSSLGAITAMFVELFGAMMVFATVAGSKLGVAGLVRLASSMMLLSLGVLVLSKAMKNLSELDLKQIAGGLIAVAALMGMLVGAAKFLPSDSKALISNSIGLVIFAGAVLILTKAVEKLGTMKPEDLAKGLIAVGFILAKLAIFMSLTDFSKMGISSAAGILLMAGSLVVMAKAVEKLGNLNVKQLAKGLGSIAVLLIEINLFIKYLDPKDAIKTAASLVIIGGAILVLSYGIERLGNLNGEQIGKGLFVMAGALGIMGLTLNALDNKKVLMNSFAILDLAGSLLLIAKAFGKFSELSWEQIARGLVAMGGAFAIMVISLNMMSDEIFDATAALIMAGALYILAKALETLGNLTIIQIATGLLALAGGLMVIGLAAEVMAPLAPAILVLSGALLVFGLAVALVGGGVLALSAGLAALAVSGTAGALALVAIITSLAGVIPVVFEQLGKGLVIFAKVIAESAPVIAEAFKTLVLSMLNAMVTIFPQVVDAFLNLIVTILDKLKFYLPRIAELGYDIVIALLQGVAKNIGKLGKTGVDIIVGFINAMREKLPLIIQTGFDFMIALINGMAESIRKNAPLVQEAFINLFDSVFDAFMYLPYKYYNMGKEVVQGFINGLKSKFFEAVKAGADLAGVTQEATKTRAGIASPSKEFAELGKFSVMGFANGFKNYATLAATEATNLGSSTMDALRLAMTNISDLVNIDTDMSPTIRPVLDLSNVVSGTKMIDSLMPKTPTITVSSANVQASSIATDLSPLTTNTQIGSTLEKAMNDLKNALKEPQQIIHGGQVTVKGITNEGQLIAVAEKNIMRNIELGSRRIPSGMTRTPSMA